MHELRGNGAREKTALMPNPLWRSSCGFTTLDLCRAYGHGAPLEGSVGPLPQPTALGSLDLPDLSLRLALDAWDHLGCRVMPLLAVYATATRVVTVAAGIWCPWYGFTGPSDADQSPPGPGT